MHGDVREEDEEGVYEDEGGGDGEGVHGDWRGGRQKRGA